MNRDANHEERARWLAQAERAVLGHSILSLLQRAAALEPRWMQYEEAKRLDEVYITSRYPNGLQEGTPGTFYNDRDAEQCLNLARQIIDFAKSSS